MNIASYLQKRRGIFNQVFKDFFKNDLNMAQVQAQRNKEKENPDRQYNLFK